MMMSEGLERYKVIHMVRHAEGIHNVEVEKNKAALFYPSLLDAHLSPLGWQQVGERRREVYESGLLKRIELVVASPMQRAIQTAVGVFGQEPNSESNASPLTSSVDYPPILAIELCREQIGMYPCNKRRSVSDYRSSFPMIDFSLVDSEEDQMWGGETMEKRDQVAKRGMQFMKWLWEREEKEIAVVSHGIFLQETLFAFADNREPSVTQLRKRFTNCELRSVIIHESEKEPNSYRIRLVMGSDSYRSGEFRCGIGYAVDVTKSVEEVSEG